LNIFVGSVKQGEPTGQWGTWPHSFDPQHPGCPGEAGWGPCGPELDRGHDFADWMPNEAVIEPPRGEWWEDWNSHFLGPPITVELAAVVIPVHDIAIIGITPSPTEAFVEDEVTVSVTVKNSGTITESLTLKLYYDGNLIESRNLTLSPGESLSVSFTWKTTGLRAGEYTLRAEVPAVSGETNTADNVRTLAYQLKERVPFPITWIIAVAVVVIVVLAILAVYLLRVRRKV
ncbi:MAG: CARDB domain-containing protein, partial [Candidatus Bathyarchaeia archaeon]